MKKILIITGPTASGKSSLAVALAHKLGGEVISADSMQIYQGLNIGSAKPTHEEMLGIPHHMLDIVSPFDSFSVAQFQQRAAENIDDVICRGKLPIIAGGTGLYIHSLIYPMEFGHTAGEEEIRNQLRQQSAEQGAAILHQRLAEIDPISAQRIKQNDEKRIIRALEIYYTKGKPMSEYEIEYKKLPGLYNGCIVCLNMDRNILYERINKRVDAMMSAGLLEEVLGLAAQGCRSGMQSMAAIGYKELLEHLNDGVSLEEAVERIKKNSRNYAKRQLTWFRRYEGALWLDSFKKSSEELASETIDFFRKGVYD